MPVGEAAQLANATADVLDTPSFTNAATATSASAGSAVALPALPSGYVTVAINGTNRKLAYYT